MLAEPKLKSLTDFISTLSKEELVWVNGYLSGLVSVVEKPVATPQEAVLTAGTPKKITIAYGTETGNSKKLATEFASKAKKSAVPVKLVSLDQYRLADLSKEEYFITVISTQGEGEPPIAAQKFYEHIHNNGFKVPQLKFGVLALGDTSYPLFCKTGEDVDTQLLKLGGNRIAPLQKCDLDYEDEAHRWFENVLKSVSAPSNEAVAVNAVGAPESKKPAGKIIYKGKVLSNINLNATGSRNTTYHIELAAENVNYITGDSIGIVPENAEPVVAEILSITKMERTKIVTWRNETATVEELLTRKIGINFLLEKTLKQYAAITGTEVGTVRLNLLDLLRRHPVNAAQFEELLPSLNPIAPRIYNIASSPATHEGEVHIIVKQDAFAVDDRLQFGLCTLFLEDKQPGDEVQFFVQTNKRFRLPANDKDIIMIGPGTGIAPFRSFVAERDAIGATGQNWLFFAEDKFTTDFLYQTEWQNWFATGALTKISLAFKTGLKNSFSVSQKLHEQRSELFEWIRTGATVYLCGEKEPMGKEVEETLVKIFEEQGKMDREEATKYFEQLKNSGRYVKDLY